MSGNRVAWLGYCTAVLPYLETLLSTLGEVEKGLLIEVPNPGGIGFLYVNWCAASLYNLWHFFFGGHSGFRPAKRSSGSKSCEEEGEGLSPVLKGD